VKIFEYQLETKFGDQEVSMPCGAFIVKIMRHKGKITIMAEVDEACSSCVRTFTIYETGEALPKDSAFYMETVVIHDVAYHIYGY
jgi:hypothetical protein